MSAKEPALVVERPNMYLRLLDVSKRVRKMKKEGYNSHLNAAYFSADQIEDAIGDELADAGILTNWSTVESRSYKESVWSKNAGKMVEQDAWWVRMRVEITDAFDPEIGIISTIDDTGPNLAGAVTYATKSLYKRLLHIAEVNSEEGNKSQEKPSSADNNHATVPAQESRPQSSDRPECPNCHKQVWESRYQEGQWYCNAKKDGCGWKGPKPGGTGEIPVASASASTQKAFQSKSTSSIGPTPKPKVEQVELEDLV